MSRRKKLNQYTGKLDAAQVAEGINAASRNAKRLAEDAALLLEAGRYPSAASLAILSIEESGKRDILRWLALLSGKEEVAKQWRNYRSHTKKNVLWPFHMLVALGAKKLDHFHSLFRKDSTHPFTLDQIKQVGFYTDCVGRADWSVPDEQVGEDLAGILVHIAQQFITDREVTPKEMELWIKHLDRPVRLNDPVLFKQGLVEWQAEMQQLGLALEADNELEQFLGLQDSKD